jgi:hypothetical protein
MAVLLRLRLDFDGSGRGPERCVGVESVRRGGAAAAEE